MMHGTMNVKKKQLYGLKIFLNQRKTKFFTLKFINKKNGKEFATWQDF